jgi:hypothetical protein
MGRSHHPARSETASRLTSAALRRTHAPAFPDSDSSAAYARVQRIATAPRHAGKGRVVLAHALPFFAARLALALYRLRLFTTSPYRTDTPTARQPCGSSTTHGRSHRSQSGWSLLACARSCALPAVPSGLCDALGAIALAILGRTRGKSLASPNRISITSHGVLARGPRHLLLIAASLDLREGGRNLRVRHSQRPTA